MNIGIPAPGPPGKKSADAAAESSSRRVPAQPSRPQNRLVLRNDHLLDSVEAVEQLHSFPRAEHQNRGRQGVRRHRGRGHQAGAEAYTGGELSREDWAWGVDLLLTRSFSNRLRIHLNGGYVLASEVDGDDYWRGGIAFDIPVGFSSRLIMGDLYTEIPADTGPTRTWAELGTRVQITNLTVIDMGLATRLDEWNRGVANVRLVVGFSRVFGIGGLVRVPEYPNPRIR